MEVRYIQGIRIRSFAIILQRHTHGHGKLTKLCLCIGRGAEDHYKGNDERPIHSDKNIEKNKTHQVRNCQHHIFLTQSPGRDKNPHTRVGPDPKKELLGGRSDTGYKKENREFGISLGLSMVRPAGVQQLIKFFGRFSQHTR